MLATSRTGAWLRRLIHPCMGRPPSVWGRPARGPRYRSSRWVVVGGLLSPPVFSCVPATIGRPSPTRHPEGHARPDRPGRCCHDSLSEMPTDGHHPDVRDRPRSRDSDDCGCSWSVLGQESHRTGLVLPRPDRHKPDSFVGFVRPLSSSPGCPTDANAVAGRATPSRTVLLELEARRGKRPLRFARSRRL